MSGVLSFHSLLDFWWCSSFQNDFQKDNQCLSHVWCFLGFLFGYTLSVLPVHYYIINDSSSFELIDFLSHVMYAPISSLFFYLYDRFNIKLNLSLVYIISRALVSVSVERIGGIISIFCYQHGYTIYYSFVIYLLVIRNLGILL